MRLQLCVICVWVLFLVVLFAGGCRLVLFFYEGRKFIFKANYFSTSNTPKAKLFSGLL